MAAFAVGVWLVTVAGAYAMDRAGWRGPAEVLLRRLTYGTAINPPAGKTGYSMARRSRSSRLSQARRVRRAGSA